jgi:salicylate hydroxylase
MRVVIIGGGVAGSATAVAMRRIGADVTVYEAYRDPAGPYGSFVSLAGNGLRALDSLGALAAVQAAGFPVDRQLMWSGSGRPLGDVPRGRRASDPLRSVTLMRSDLVAALRAVATRSGARIVTGERVLADDNRCAEADLVIAADGIRSRPGGWSTLTPPSRRSAGSTRCPALPTGLPRRRPGRST